MVSLNTEEEEIIDALASCLSIAVNKSDSAEFADLNKTKTQKLIYLAIEDFDLPVSYCWYLAGSMVESGFITPDTLESAFDTLPQPDSPSMEAAHESDEGSRYDEDPSDESQPPRRLDADTEMAKEFEMTTSSEDRLDGIVDNADTATADTATQSTSEHGAHPENQIFALEHPDAVNHSDIAPSKDTDFPTEDIIHFLESQLNTYPLTSNEEFLMHFYHHHAPKQYQTLYESSLHIRGELRSIRNHLESVHQNGRSLDGLGKKINGVTEHITKLHFELSEHDDLRPTVQAVISGTDLIEDALMMVNQLSKSEVNSEHIDAIEELQSIFFNGIWKYPVLKISAKTATGPSADKIRERRDAQFDSFEDELSEMQTEAEEQLSQAGLIPSFEDYPDPENDDMGRAITDLFTNYSTTSDPD
jgi:hypothetical protein